MESTPNTKKLKLAMYSAQTDVVTSDATATENVSAVLTVSETAPVVVTLSDASPEKTLQSSKNIVREIKDITKYATVRLDALGDSTFAADQYEAAIQGLNDLKKIVTGFERLLSRSNAALLDEKAQLLKRLEEIQRATNVRSGDTIVTEVKTKESKPREAKQSWADVTEAEERHPTRHQGRQQQSRFRADSPDSIDSSRNVVGESANRIAYASRRTDDFEEPKHRSGRKGNNRGGRGQLNIPFLSTGNDASSGRDTSSGRDGNTPGKLRTFDDSRPKIHQGSRIPPISANPLMLKRRITLDDLECFAMNIKQDVKYGELVTFTSPASGEITIGGIINVGVVDKSASRSGICEPLYLEGMCNCKTTALVLHGGKPLQLSVHDFIGVLHKFINNFNGNHFHPSDVSKIHIDAVILRCVVYAIAQIIGFRRGGMIITLDTFSDVTEPRNLLNAVDEYYKSGKDEIGMSVARGLFIALGTHFVSS